MPFLVHLDPTPGHGAVGTAEIHPDPRRDGRESVQIGLFGDGTAIAKIRSRLGDRYLEHPRPARVRPDGSPDDGSRRPVEAGRPDGVQPPLRAPLDRILPLVALAAPWLAGNAQALLDAIRRHPDCPPPFRQTAHARLAAAHAA